MSELAIIWGVVGLYLTVIIGKGLWKARAVRDVDDYLLAGRDVPWFPLLCTLGATLIGGGASIGAIGKTAEWGVLMAAVSLGWYAHFALAGWWIAPRMREARAYTVAGYLGTAFGAGPRRIATVLSVGFSVFIVAAQMAAFGTVLSAILPGSDATTLRVAIIVGGAAVIAYSAAGGLVAVIATDLWQFAILLVGFIVVAALCGARLAVGDLHPLPESFLAIDGGKGAIFLVTTFLAFLLGEAFAPGYATRFCAGRDAGHIRRGAVGAGVALGLVFPALVLVIAWYARASAPPGSVAASLPMVIADVGGPWIAGLMVAALLCAVMSSADSALNSATAVFLKDVCERELGWQPQARALLVARICTVVVGLMAVAVASITPDIIGLLLFTYHWWAPAIVLPVLVAALLPWAHGRSRRVAFAMLVAIAATMGYRVSGWDGQVDPVVVGVAACACSLLATGVFRRHRAVLPAPAIRMAG